MSIKKEFNNWVSRNFKGLYPETLVQFLCMEGYTSFYADEYVYIDLFHVFNGTANEDERETYNAVSALVSNCEWL